MVSLQSPKYCNENHEPYIVSVDSIRAKEMTKMDFMD